jgi:putative ABC transport system permease protein
MSLLQDIRFAIRLLVKDKWFTLVAVAALALGIGVNATVFTFVNAVLIRGLPFNDPDRIMSLAERNMARGVDLGVSYLNFEDWKAAQKSFVGLAAWSGTTMNVSDEGRTPERYQGPYMSWSAFKLIGQQPALGRDFREDDDTPGAQPVAILGGGIWKSRYGSDPNILGRTIKINDVPTTVIGVMPEGMKFPVGADLWLPLAQMPQLATQKRQQHFSLQAFGRLADGVTREQAQTELKAIAARLAHDFPEANKDISATVMTFNERFNGGPIRLVFLSLMGAVGFVLLIACANVANLLLARSAQRAREIGVRVSLGATRWRIVRQLLVESMLLAVVSGVLGFVLAVAGTRWFDAVTQDVGKPYWIKFTMDGSVFGFFAAVCLATGIIFGLAPALHISRTDINEVLKEAGGRSGSGGVRARRWTAALIVVEIALTLVLLAGAGFMIRSFLTLYRLDLGVETGHLLTLALALPDRKYPTPETRAAFYQRLDERLAALSTIRGATIAGNTPFGGGAALRLTVEGRPTPAGEQPPQVTRVVVGPRYFDTIGLHLVRGRPFADSDGTTGHEVAIVNQRFVSMHFPNEDPVGRRIKLVPDQPSGAGPEPVFVTIVGVSPTVRQRAVQEPDPDPVVYMPYRALPSQFMALIVRTPGEPAQLTTAIREEVRALDPDLPLFGIRTLDEALAQQRWPFRIFGTMFAIFATIALLLSAVGLYAITAYSVTQRTQEIGVRMALGAQSSQLWWLVLRGGMVQLAIGLVIGMAGAFGVGRLLKSLLVQQTPNDPVTLASIALLFVVVSLAACLYPASRATRLDPVHALRYE